MPAPTLADRGPLWVILPTYNESDNIGPMVEALGPKLTDGDRILIVDDNSPDGTGELADEIAAKNDSVEVLHRTRQGRPRTRLHRRLQGALSPAAPS